MQKYLVMKRAEKERQQLDCSDLLAVEDDGLKRSEVGSGKESDEGRKDANRRESDYGEEACDPYEIKILNVEVDENALIRGANY